MSKAEILTIKTFDDKIEKNPVPVLVDFFAEWCGPCRMMGPVLDDVAEKRAGKVSVCKVNCEDDGDIAGKYGVSGIPCFILFHKGEELDRRVGACSLEDMLAWVDRNAK